MTYTNKRDERGPTWLLPGACGNFGTDNRAKLKKQTTVTQYRFSECAWWIKRPSSEPSQCLYFVIWEKRWPISHPAMRRVALSAVGGSFDIVKWTLSKSCSVVGITGRLQGMPGVWGRTTLPRWTLRRRHRSRLSRRRTRRRMPTPSEVCVSEEICDWIICV